MSQTIKVTLVAVVIFLLAPMPIVYKYTETRYDFDCGFARSGDTCAVDMPINNNPHFNITNPILAVTVNEETLDFYSGTKTEVNSTSYYVNPVLALIFPLSFAVGGAVLFQKRYNKKLVKKASKKQKMNVWKQ